MNTTDLIGKKFGKLTVLKFDRIEHKRDDKGRNRDKGYWLCKCDCGNEIIVARNLLIANKRKSCGCIKKELAQEQAKKKLIDLTGRRINQLVVIGLERKERKKCSNGKSKTNYYWKCKCDCGREVIVNGKYLREGKIKDCKEVIRNQTKNYTQIGNEFKEKYILKEGTRLDNLSGKLSKANTSGVRGVSFKKDKNKYKATIKFKNKTYFLGYFWNLEDAREARKKAEMELYQPILEKYNYKSKNQKENEEEFE